MAFIEPRLIHLLNDSTTPHLPHADLPTFSEGFNDSPDRLPPFESLASRHDDSRTFDTLHFNSAASLTTSDTIDDSSRVGDCRRDGETIQDRPMVGGVPRIPLRLLLGETEDAGSLSYPPKAVAEDSQQQDEGQSEVGSKKRQRVLASKDDVMHLPQPVKKQKAAPQPRIPTMPPIINGLHEPPPNAALFPPISSNEFDHPQHPSSAPNHTTEPRNKADEKADDSPAKPKKTNSTKTRKKAMKPRRKWSETETNHLLLGVSRHGVGKWTDILADPDFAFNERTAGDLKDRFRTCCPDELRKSGDKKKAGFQPDLLPTPPAEPKEKAKTGLFSENILIEADDDPEQDHADLASGNNEYDGAAKAKKTRAHRKKMEDLAELGIHGPFKKSRRRERRPFSREDDRLIIEGLKKYGPAWTKIQRDPQYSLHERQPTDLRDRVRNKYPAIYDQIEKGTLRPKDPKAGDLLEPSLDMAGLDSAPSGRTVAGDATLPRTNSREELSRQILNVSDTSDLSASSQGGDLGNLSSFANAGGMDISRLLLDDPQP